MKKIIISVLLLNVSIALFILDIISNDSSDVCHFQVMREGNWVITAHFLNGNCSTPTHFRGNTFTIKNLPQDLPIHIKNAILHYAKGKENIYFTLNYTQN